MRRGGLVALVVFAVVTTLLAVYGASLAGPKLLDDAPVLASASRPDAWFSATGPLGRPISMASFRLSLLTTGDAVLPLKATNLAFHVLVGLLVFLLFRMVFLQATLSGVYRCSLSPNELAAWLSILWLLHPAHVSTVLYITQRMAILAALFSTFALLVTLKLAASKPIEQRRGLACAATVLFVLAALSKETGLLALPLLAVMALAPGTHLHEPRNHWVLQCAILSGGGLAAALLLAFTLSFPDPLAEVFAARGWSPVERLLSMSRVLSLYAEQVLVPRVSLFPFFYDWFPASRGLFVPASTAISLTVLFATLLFIAFGSRRSAMVRCGLAWFLVCHSLEASVWPLELVFEHRNYLASVGVILALVWLIAAHVKRSVLARLILGGWMLGIVGVTALHASDWRSAALLAANAVRLHPESVAARSALAEAALAAGSPEAALHLLNAIDSPALRLQGLYVTCSEGLPASWPDDLSRTANGSVGVNSQLTTAAIEVSRLVLDGKCGLDPARLASFLSALTERGHFVHSMERERLLVYAAQLFDLSGDHALAVATGLGSHKGSTPSTHRILLAAELAAIHGLCDSMRLALGQLPEDLPELEATMAEATSAIVSESSCGKRDVQGEIE